MSKSGTGHEPVVPVTQEAEAGGLFEPKTSLGNAVRLHVKRKHQACDSSYEGGIGMGIDF
jgi:hypothetical protein